MEKHKGWLRVGLFLPLCSSEQSWKPDFDEGRASRWRRAGTATVEVCNVWPEVDAERTEPAAQPSSVCLPTYSSLKSEKPTTVLLLYEEITWQYSRCYWCGLGEKKKQIKSEIKSVTILSTLIHCRCSNIILWYVFLFYRNKKKKNLNIYYFERFWKRLTQGVLQQLVIIATHPVSCYNAWKNNFYVIYSLYN